MSKSVRHKEEVSASAETFTLESERFVEAKLDTSAHVLRNVPINNGPSKNGIDYTPALESAVASKVYENAVVFLNHVGDKQSRKVEEKFGWLANVRFVEGKGIRGDLHYNPKHIFAEAFEWWAANKPEALGLSHDAYITIDKNSRKVESIDKVVSVDIVHEPATVGGIQEGVIADKLRERKLHDIVSAASNLMYASLYPMDKTPTEQEMVDSLMEIVKDLRKELKSLGGQVTENVTENSKENTEMDLSKITLDDLKAKAPQLVAAAVKEHTDNQAKIAATVAAIFADVPATLKTDALVAKVTEAVAGGFEDIAKSLVAAVKDAIPAVKPAATSFGTVATQATEQKQEEKKATSFDDVLKTLNA